MVSNLCHHLVVVDCAHSVSKKHDNVGNIRSVSCLYSKHRSPHEAQCLSNVGEPFKNNWKRGLNNSMIDSQTCFIPLKLIFYLQPCHTRIWLLEQRPASIQHRHNHSGRRWGECCQKTRTCSEEWCVGWKHLLVVEHGKRHSHSVEADVVRQKQTNDEVADGRPPTNERVDTKTARLIDKKDQVDCVAFCRKIQPFYLITSQNITTRVWGGQLTRVGAKWDRRTNVESSVDGLIVRTRTTSGAGEASAVWKRIGASWLAVTCAVCLD